jgi:hypothetical protein
MLICFPSNYLTIILIIQETSLNIMVLIAIIVTEAKRAHTDGIFLHAACPLLIHSRKHLKAHEFTNQILYPMLLSIASTRLAVTVTGCAGKGAAQVVWNWKFPRDFLNGDDNHDKNRFSVVRLVQNLRANIF